MHTSLPSCPESLARRHRLRRLLAFGIALVLGLFLIPTGRADLVIIDGTKITNHIVFTNDTVILTNGTVIPMPAVTFPSPVSRASGVIPIQLGWGMPLPLPVTVTLQITGGSAIPGVDYTYPSPIGFPVLPGSTATVLPISLLDPITVDPAADIRFTITLTFPGLAPISLGERTAGLLADVPIDPPLGSEYSFGSTFASGAPVEEGGPARIIDVIRTGDLSTPGSVRVSNTPGTGTVGVDFGAVDTVLQFPPGMCCQSVSVVAFADAIADPGEAFSLQLSNPVGGVLGLHPFQPVYIGDIVKTNPPTPTADLSLSSSITPSPLALEEEFTITVSVANGGPALAPGVTVSAPLPTEAEFISATPPGAYNAGTGIWTVGSLVQGENRTLTLRGRARAAADRILPHEITASGVPDPDSIPGNGLPGEDDIAFVQFKADEKLADLALSMEARPPQTNITDKITLVVTLRNYGLDPAKDIRIVNRLPAGLQLDSHKVSAGAFAPATGTWTVPALATDATATLELVVKTTRGGSYTNVATIEASAPRDPSAANNRAEAVATFNGYSICGIAKVCWTGSGVPNTNAAVTLDGPLKLTTRTDSLGTFCFTNLPPGKYKVTVVAANATLGIENWTQDVEIIKDSIEVAPDSRWLAIVGRVTSGSNGPPVGGITIEASAPGEAKRTATTDANGEYRFLKLAKKEYTIQPINLPEGVTHDPASIKIDTGTDLSACPLRADFILTAKFRISGLIRACDPKKGTPLASAIVTLTNKNFSVPLVQRTGTDGRYAFTNLPPGDYTITVTHPTFTFKDSPAKVTIAKANVVQNFTGDGDSSIGGRIATANGQAVPGIVVEIRQLVLNRPPIIRQATTDTNGEFVIKNLPNATYFIVPTPPDKGFTFTPKDATRSLPADKCRNYVLFTANRSAVEIVAIEAVQVIQDWQNNVPLVHAKPTLIRAFVKPAGSNALPVTMDGVRLRVERNGRSTTYGAERHIARTNYLERRNEKNASLPFRLGADDIRSTNEVTLTLEWPNGLLTTAQLPGQTAVRNNSTGIRYRKMPEAAVRWVLVKWIFGKDSKAATLADASKQHGRLRSGLPTHAVSTPDGNRQIDWTTLKDPRDPANDRKGELSAVLLHELARFRNKDLDPLGLGEVRDRQKYIYHGVATGTDLRGMGEIELGRVSFADSSAAPESRKNLSLHEVGHVLGRHHAVHTVFGTFLRNGIQFKRGLCEEEAVAIAPDYPMDMLGTDLFTPVLGPMRLGPYRHAFGWDSGDALYVSPFQTADVMSYCGSGNSPFSTEWVWPGIFSYRGMMDAILARWPLPTAPRRLAAIAGEPIPVLRLSGLMDGSGEITQMDPIEFRTEEWVPDFTGEFLAQVRNQAGELLAEQSLEINAIIPDGASSEGGFHREFSVALPILPGIAHVDLVRAGLTLRRISVSPNSPVVEFIPTPSTTPIPLPPEGLHFDWTTSDADGDSLRTEIQIGSESGGWAPITFDRTTAGYTLEPAHFPKAGTYHLRLIVSDGYNRTIATHPTPILVADKAPVIATTEPADGAHFAASAAVRLAASAIDPEDGSLSEVHWSHPTLGELGIGEDLELPAGTLPTGTHNLAATVTDSGGHTARAELEITIDPPVEPVLTLTLTDTALELRWPLESADLRLVAAYELDADSWFPVETEILTDDDSFLVRLPLEDEALFYRLLP
jgi:uncharacterized repeat protein (TIGR01451 family)